MIDWFRRWLGYPEGADGLFTSGGSAASVDAFVAAREAVGHPERATAYMSDQTPHRGQTRRHDYRCTAGARAHDSER